LYSIILKQDNVDKLCWKPSKKGLFDVRFFYNVPFPHDSIHFHWRYIWCSKAPLRVTFFAWSAALGKILTLDNLRKRNIIVIDWCCLYKKSRQTVDHLLLHCETASMELYLRLVRLSVGHASSSEISCLLERAISIPPSEAIWKMIPLYTTRCIWKERNDQSIKDSERTVAELKAFFFNSLFHWMAAYNYFLFIFFL
jgi:hypothetical protein